MLIFNAHKNEILEIFITLHRLLWLYFIKFGNKFYKHVYIIDPSDLTFNLGSETSI